METFIYERNILSIFKREFHYSGRVVSDSEVACGDNGCVLIILSLWELQRSLDTILNSIGR